MPRACPACPGQGVVREPRPVGRACLIWSLAKTICSCRRRLLKAAAAVQQKARGRRRERAAGKLLYPPCAGSKCVSVRGCGCGALPGAGRWGRRAQEGCSGRRGSAFAKRCCFWGGGAGRRRWWHFRPSLDSPLLTTALNFGQAGWQLRLLDARRLICVLLTLPLETGTAGSRAAPALPPGLAPPPPHPGLRDAAVSASAVASIAVVRNTRTVDI